MKKLIDTTDFEFYSPVSSEMNILFGGNAMAGFIAQADDYLFQKIDLKRELIKHPESTFCVRVKGNSMDGDFQEGDLLIIDRSLEFTDNKIALCFIDNGFTLKRIKLKDGKCFLVPSNEDFPLIEVKEGEDVIIWGVVAYSIKKH